MHSAAIWCWTPGLQGMNNSRMMATAPMQPTRTSMPSPPEEPHDEQAASAAEAGSDEAQQVDSPQDAPEAVGDVVAPAAGADAEREPSADEAESTEQPAPKPPDYKAVARISTQVALQSIELTSLHAELKDGVALPADWAASASTTSDASADFDRDALKLTVYCAFVAAWAPEASANAAMQSSETAPFDLRARFRLEYALSGLNGILEGDEEHFARTNGMLHAWPYWREAAQSMTVRMGLAPLVVGTFKIPWSGDPGREKKRKATDRTAADRQDAEPTDEVTVTATPVEVSGTEKQAPPS
jgi:hypothetical protein